MGTKEATSLIRLNTATSSPVLVVAHGWGGHLFDPAQLGADIRETFSIYGLQPRERSGGKPHNKFTEMCRDYASEIAATLPDTPVVLYGYSLGGVIAYGTAYELQQLGHPVAEIIAVDAYPSNLPLPIYLLSIIPHFTRRTLIHLSKAIAKPTQFLTYIAQRRTAVRNVASRFAHKDDQSEASQEHDHQTALAANPAIDYHQCLADRYTPKPLPIDVTLIRCRHTSGFLYPRWRYLCRAKLRSSVVDFTHHNLICDEGFAILSDLVHQRLTSRTDKASGKLA